jgi:hypothetical protein
VPCHGGSVSEQPLKGKELRVCVCVWCVCVRACVCARGCVDKEVGAAELESQLLGLHLLFFSFSPIPIWW